MRSEERREGQSPAVQGDWIPLDGVGCREGFLGVLLLFIIDGVPYCSWVAREASMTGPVEVSPPPTGRVPSWTVRVN